MFAPNKPNTIRAKREVFAPQLAWLILQRRGVSKRLCALTGLSKAEVSLVLHGHRGASQRFTQLAVAALIEHQEKLTAQEIITRWAKPGNRDSRLKIPNSELRDTAGGGTQLAQARHNDMTPLSAEPALEASANSEFPIPEELSETS